MVSPMMTLYLTMAETQHETNGVPYGDVITVPYCDVNPASEDEIGWLAETIFNRYPRDFFSSFFACVHARMHTNKHIC